MITSVTVILHILDTSASIFKFFKYPRMMLVSLSHLKTSNSSKNSLTCSFPSYSWILPPFTIGINYAVSSSKQSFLQRLMQKRHRIPLSLPTKPSNPLLGVVLLHRRERNLFHSYFSYQLHTPEIISYYFWCLSPGASYSWPWLFWICPYIPIVLCNSHPSASNLILRFGVCMR